MKDFQIQFEQNQKIRNDQLLKQTLYMRDSISSQVLPFYIDVAKTQKLSNEQITTIQALEIDAARTAILSLASLAKINELDHLGGGLDLIPALTLTLSLVDYEKVEFTIENAHASIGYYSTLAVRGFLSKEIVIEKFRRGLDIAGHVSWLPGGTQLNGGRLGIMIPVAVGQALGKKALYGNDAWIIVHCGDAGWISGQALNGFNGADLHNAPVTFIMHRNGIQLSGSNKQIMNKDPRPVIKSLGIEIIEIPSLHDTEVLYTAYREAHLSAKKGKPVMIYPTGFGFDKSTPVTLEFLAEKYGIRKETEAFAAKNKVALNTKIWIPGSLMSYRDIEPMLECVFLVNDLPGGHGHHDGHMKGRDAGMVLSNPMLTFSESQNQALQKLQDQPKVKFETKARPAVGSKNLVLPQNVVKSIELPMPGKWISPRAGVEAGYAAVAKTFPQNMFVVSCDLDPSTKLGKARTFLSRLHQFEMSIEEQVSALMANGLAMSSYHPQLNVFSTFSAFFEGIAREGMEMWRYQRNLNGSNEGLNVTFHLSHVGACTGRDHFSGWSLDWINLAIGYLPYLHRFYAPADARSAFIAVRDLAACYGGHIIGIPRDNLPVLTAQDEESPLWSADSPWEAVTSFRKTADARKAILAFGAPAFLAEQAVKKLSENEIPVDAYVINGLPLPEKSLHELAQTYPGGLVTIEDGLIGTRSNGFRGFAGLVSGALYNSGTPMAHIGICDPCIAPSDGHMEVWEHFGITADALVQAVKNL